MNMSDFAHALGRGVGGGGGGGVGGPMQQQQMNMNNINFAPSSGQQPNSLTQQQHQHQQQQLAAIRMQQQNQQQQQPNFQSVSQQQQQQQQQRMNVGVNPSGIPGMQQQRQVIGSMPPSLYGGKDGGMPPPGQVGPPGQLQSQQLNQSQPQRSPLTLQQQQQQSSNPFPSLQQSNQSLSNNSQLTGPPNGLQNQRDDLLQSMMKQQQGGPSGYNLQQQHSLNSLVQPPLGGGLGGGLSGLNGQQIGQHDPSNPALAPRFDMSDFPALSDMGDGSNKLSNLNQGGGGLNTTLAGQLSLNQQGQQDSSFMIQNEDFPALGGGSGATRRIPPTTTASLGGQTTAASILQQRAVGGTIGQTTPASGVPPSSISTAVAAQQAASLNQTPVAQSRHGLARPKAATCDKFGLTGLLSVIRMTDPDLNTLALGTDLTTLGLNLNSSDVLYATFSAPCLDVPTRSEPDFVLPPAYYMQPPALKTSHLAKFTLETLFYIFYNMPKDTLQVYAAKELYKREWRYHKELKLWFSRSTNMTPPNSTTPAPGLNPDGTKKDGGINKDGSKEIGKDGKPTGGDGGGSTGGDANTYLFFDINAWERRVFRDTHILQPNKFMTEEELTAL